MYFIPIILLKTNMINSNIHSLNLHFSSLKEFVDQKSAFMNYVTPITFHHSISCSNVKHTTEYKFFLIFLYFWGCFSKLALNSGASWARTAETTPVKTVGSVLTVWMVQYVSVKQASRETGISQVQIH